MDVTVQNTTSDHYSEQIGDSFGLRPLLIAAVVILTTTLTAMVSSTFFAAYKNRQAIEIELQDRAVMLARSIDLRLQVYQTAVMAIAQSNSLQDNLDIVAIANEMQRLEDLFGGWFVVTIDGAPFNTLPTAEAQTAPASGLNSSEVTAAEGDSLRVRWSVISDAFLEPISNELGVAAVMPIDSSRSVADFVKVLVTLRKITTWVEEATLAEGEFATLADGSRRVIARSRGTNELISSGLPDWYIRFSAGRDSGVTVGPPAAGSSPQIFALQRLEVAPVWTVTVSRPLPSVLSSTIRSAWPGLSAFFVFLISSGFAAFILDRMRNQSVAASKACAATERERLLVEIRAADARKARLMAVLAHDLRTPLIAILAALDILGVGRDSKSWAQILERTQRNGHEMLQLIDDVLELARLGTSELIVSSEPFFPAMVLEEVAELVRAQAAKQDTEVVTQIGELPPLQGDVAALRRILINFATNAVKATKGGSVLLSVTADQQGPDGYLVTFSATDTGHGISAEDIPRLFQDFGMLERQQVEQYGTRLGLAICRRLAEAMGGTLGVESTVDEGSRFWLKLTLPEADSAKAHSIHGRKDPTRVLSGLRVLVAEDHDTIRQLTCAGLARCGAATTEAVDGTEAVALANDNQFDLILMDLRMPQLDGAEAAKRIRSGGGPSATARIVGLTAHQESATAAMLSNFAIEACLPKPLDLQQLAELWLGTAKPTPNLPTPENFDNETMASLRDVDGGALLVRTLRQLSGEIVAARTELAKLIYDRDVEGSKQLSHKLAGFCDFLGAHYLSDELKDFETLTEADNTEYLVSKLKKTQEVMDRTRKEADRLADEIDSELDSAAGNDNLS